MKVIESISKKELLLFIDTRILELEEEQQSYRAEARERSLGAQYELEKLKSYLLKSKAEENV